MTESPLGGKEAFYDPAVRCLIADKSMASGVCGAPLPCAEHPTEPPLREEELAEMEVSWPERYGRETVLRLIAALHASRARVKELEELLDQAQLRSIEARNPGIDIQEVDRFRKCPRNPCQCGHHRDRT